MTGYVHITGAELPEQLSQEEGRAAYGFRIEIDCVMDSRVETVTMVHNLCKALSFRKQDYEALVLLSEYPDGLSEYDFTTEF